MTNSPLVTVIEALERLGRRYRHIGDQVDAQCPAHDDQAPSLSARYDRTAGKVLINCHTGCSPDSVVEALNLTWADLFDPKQEVDRVRRPEIVATYDYTDEDGEVLFQKVRLVPKDFRARKPDGRGGWEYRLGDVRRVLYRLHEVRGAIAASQPVLFCEGEKDADRAADELGVVATCNFEGAAKEGQRPKWRPEYAEQLRGAHVLVVADNDSAGFAHARSVAGNLAGVAAQVRVFRPAVDAEKADLSDHLDAGYGLQDLRPLEVGASDGASASLSVSPSQVATAQLYQLAGYGTQNPQNVDGAGASTGSEGFEGVSPGEWNSPTPLPGRTDPLPTDAAGPVLGPLVDAIGACLQVPTDLPLNLALPLITTAAKGGWVAEVEPGWTEPICIATLSALPSGERKSPTLRLLDHPLREHERNAQAAKRPEIAQQAARKKLVEGKVEELRKKALKGLDDGANERAYLDEVAKFAELTVDPLPRFLVDDATPEAFVSLLAEHGAIGAVSAEPGLFGILAGRYSSGTPNIEWLLKATSGETITVDRVGREGEQVNNPALSIACCIQPGRLVELGKVTAFRESGLLARQLYAVPESNVGHRTRTKQVPPELVDAWAVRLTNLAEAGTKRRDAGTVQTLRLDQAARDALEEFRGRIEPHLHPDYGRYAGIADWMNKLPGGTVRIAAALTLLEDPNSVEIRGTVMADAVRIGTAYISHAIAAFGMTRPNAETYAQAKQVLAVIRRLASDTGSASRRDIHQKIRDRAWVETADSLERPLAVLTEYGHIRLAPKPEGKPGRPSDIYELNPELLAEIDPQNPQNIAS